MIWNLYIAVPTFCLAIGVQVIVCRSFRWSSLVPFCFPARSALWSILICEVTIDAHYFSMCIASYSDSCAILFVWMRSLKKQWMENLFFFVGYSFDQKSWVKQVLVGYQLLGFFICELKRRLLGGKWIKPLWHYPKWPFLCMKSSLRSQCLIRSNCNVNTWVHLQCQRCFF